MYPRVEGVRAAVRPFSGLTSAVAIPRCQTPAHISMAAGTPLRACPETEDDMKFKTSVV